MKIFILSIFFGVFLFPTSGSGQASVTFTNQADFDSFVFSSGLWYDITLDNDTTLPEALQVNNLLPLLALDTIFSLYLINTKVTSLDGMQNADILARFVVIGDIATDTLIVPQNISSIGKIKIEKSSLLYVGGFEGLTQLSQVFIVENRHLKRVVFDLPDMDSAWVQGLEMWVRLNDSLETFYWNNPHHMLAEFSFFENRALKHVHLETVRDNVSVMSIAEGGFVFNPELDSISGCKDLQLLFSMSFIKNYKLDNACAFQEGIQKTIDLFPNAANSFVVQQNAVGLRSLSDLLAADCSYLIDGIPEPPREPLQIYPNPTEGTVYIEGHKPGGKYYLYDMQGRVLQSGIPGADGRINVARLPKGFYILEAAGKRVKLVKQ